MWGLVGGLCLFCVFIVELDFLLDFDLLDYFFLDFEGVFGEEEVDGGGVVETEYFAGGERVSDLKRFVLVAPFFVVRRAYDCHVVD